MKPTSKQISDTLRPPFRISSRAASRRRCISHSRGESVLHCKNPIEVEDEWISDYKLENGNINVADVDTELVEKIPTATQMGKVYQRLIFDTALPQESEVDGIIRVYNDPICKVIDNYNCSAYYEPSYVIARAYQNGGF